DVRGERQPVGGRVEQREELGVQRCALGGGQRAHRARGDVVGGDALAVGAPFVLDRALLERLERRIGEAALPFAASHLRSAGRRQLRPALLERRAGGGGKRRL